MPPRTRIGRRIPLTATLTTGPEAGVVSYNPADRLFTVEASRLGLPPGVRPDTVRLVSHRTGRPVDVAFVGVEQDAEGEVTGWRYEANPADVGPIALLVIND